MHDSHVIYGPWCHYTAFAVKASHTSLVHLVPLQQQQHTQTYKQTQVHKVELFPEFSIFTSVQHPPPPPPPTQYVSAHPSILLFSVFTFHQLLLFHFLSLS